MTTTNNDTQVITACRLLKGKLIHAAIETTMKNPYSGNEFRSYKAVCGRRPPRTSLTYGYSGTKEAVNCRSCLKVIARESA